VSPSVIFETRMHSRRSLTDQIEWWASNAATEDPNTANVPSILRERITRRQVQVVEMYHQPGNEGVRERGEQALAWLKEEAHIEPIIEGDRVTGWRKVERSGMTHQSVRNPRSR
jgi:hypothetical protein